MRVFIGVVFIVMLMAGGTWAGSEPPAPSPRKHTQKEQTRTETENYKTNKLQNDTQSLPAVISDINPPIHDTGSKQSTANQNSEPPPDWWLVIPTITSVPTFGLEAA